MLRPTEEEADALVERFRSQALPTTFLAVAEIARSNAGAPLNPASIGDLFGVLIEHRLVREDAGGEWFFGFGLAQTLAGYAEESIPTEQAEISTTSHPWALLVGHYDEAAGVPPG